MPTTDCFKYSQIQTDLKAPSNTRSLTCAVILNWNGWQDTIECLHSLLNADTCPDTIVVVDNSSTDESFSHIHSWANKYFPKITFLNGTDANRSEQLDSPPPLLIIKNRANLGYAGGNNVGISWAVSQKLFDFIWILNNDVLVKHDSLAKLLEYSGQMDAGVLGSTITAVGNNNNVIQCAGGSTYNPTTTIFSPFLAGMKTDLIPQDLPPKEFDYIYGASLFVKEAVFVQCGLFSEDYFLFYEEIDFCRRAKHKGYKLAWCKDSILHHKISQSVGRPDSGNKEKIAFANYHENLSTLLFTKKSYPWILPLAMLFRFFGKLVMLSKRREWYLVHPLLDAFRDFITGRNQRERYGVKRRGKRA